MINQCRVTKWIGKHSGNFFTLAFCKTKNSFRKNILSSIKLFLIIKCYRSHFLVYTYIYGRLSAGIGDIDSYSEGYTRESVFTSASLKQAKVCFRAE